MKKLFRGMLLVIAAVYAGLLVYAVFMSDGVIFQPHPSSYKDSAEILKLTSANGKKISALYLPNASARFTLLVSHGNAEDLGDDRDWLEGLRRPGFNAFSYHYQVYGTSEGQASER